MITSMKNKRGIKPVLYNFLVILLVLSTIMPSMAFAATEDDVLRELIVTPTFGSDPATRITEQEIANSDEAEGAVIKTLTLTLPEGIGWANDIITVGKKELIRNSMVVSGDVAAWDLYKGKIGIAKVVDEPRKLLLTFPKFTEFKLTDNQKITMNFSSALLEQWPGTVLPIELDLIAKARISLGGSIQAATTIESLEKGGKVIELTLLNATWNQSKIKTGDGLNDLLDKFTAVEPSMKWDLAQKLKLEEPNNVIKFPTEQTLQIIVPALSSPTGLTHTGDVNFKLDASFYTVEPSDVGDLIAGKELKFTINASDVPSLVISQLEEKELVNTGSSLTLTLTNATWSIDSGGKLEKGLALIDAFNPKDQTDQWALIKQAWKNGLESKHITITGTHKDTLTIDLPKIEGLELAKDQTIALKVPYQLLTTNVAIKEEFLKIVAQPKVILSGTALPSISQADFAKGGKLLTLTLTNAKWNLDVANNTVKREHLLNAFFAGKNFENTIYAGADVKRMNDTTVTIKLPAITHKFTGAIDFSPQLIVDKSLLQLPLSNFRIDKVENVTNVLEIQNQTLSVTTTIKTDFDLNKEKQTVTLVLKNDSWIDSVDNNQISFELNGQPLTITSSERIGKDTLIVEIKQKTGFTLTEDANVDIKIDASQLKTNASAIEKKDAFKVAAVRAELSGTGKSMDAIEVEKGGKTIVITLINAEFNAVTSSDINTILTPTAGQTLPWSDYSDVKVTKNKLSFKLPATSKTTYQGEIKVEVPSNLIKDAPSNIIKKAESISIGAIGSATLTTGLQFMASDIVKGDKTIVITLQSILWDKTIETTPTKKAALVKSFTTTDQVKEWGLVTSAIVAQGKFTVDGSKLTITLPKVPGYEIIRDQKIDLIIPKTVLINYKYDVPLTNKITIKPTNVTGKQPLSEILESGLSDFVNANGGLGKIRVTVPEKKIISITTNTVLLGGKTVSTIEVLTNDEVEKVQVKLQLENSELEQVIEGKNKFIFMFDTEDPNASVQISAFNKVDSEPLEEVYKKVAKGKKTYLEAPKTPLNGSYTLYSLLTEKTLLSNILKYYSVNELEIGTSN